MPSSRLSNLGLTLTSLVVSLLVGEVVLRGFVHLPARRVLPEVRYAPHPVRRFTLLPDQQAFTYGAPVRVDSRGFRANGEGAAAGGEDRATLFALGDSFTFGLGVRDHETWPAQLEKTLAERVGRPVEVINGGTISYGVFQELNLLEAAGLATRPRIVVHALYWNDFMNAAPPPADARPVVDGNGYFTWDQLSAPRGRLRSAASLAASSSALLFSVRQAMGAWLQSGNPTAGYGAEYSRMLEAGLTDEDWRPVEEFYDALTRLGRERDFAPFVVIMPVSGLLDREAPHTHAYPAAARARLAGRGIPYLDAFQLLSSRRLHARHFLPEGADAHLNAAGYALVADAIATAILAEPGLAGRLTR